MSFFMPLPRYQTSDWAYALFKSVQGLLLLPWLMPNASVWIARAAILGTLEIMINAAISENDNLRALDKVEFKNLFLDVPF